MYPRTTTTTTKDVARKVTSVDTVKMEERQ
jgi:hypothetical protein